MTLSSVMFYMGADPYTGKEMFVARSQDEKRKQKSYFFEQGGTPTQRTQGKSGTSTQRPTKGAQRGGAKPHAKGNFKARPKR
jgi:hypothetical protein